MAIGVAGLLVGLQTYPELAEDPSVRAIDMAVLSIFIVELCVKIMAEGTHPGRFYSRKENPDFAWNCFDSAIIFFSLPFWDTITGGESSSIAILRLLRLARVVKIVKRVPQLHIIVQGVLGGLASIGYILLLLVLVLYLFAIVGLSFFGKNDPMHFGSVPVAFMTLFRVATFDNWSDLAFITIIGCEKFPGSDYYVPGSDDDGGSIDNTNSSASAASMPIEMASAGDFWTSMEAQFDRPWSEREGGLSLASMVHRALRVRRESSESRPCLHPEPQPVVGPIFWVLFVVTAGMVMLSLFVGAVTMSMASAMAELKESAEKAEQDRLRKKNLARINKAEGADGRSRQQSCSSENGAKSPRDRVRSSSLAASAPGDGHESPSTTPEKAPLENDSAALALPAAVWQKHAEVWLTRLRVAAQELLEYVAGIGLDVVAAVREFFAQLGLFESQDEIAEQREQLATLMTQLWFGDDAGAGPKEDDSIDSDSIASEGAEPQPSAWQRMPLFGSSLTRVQPIVDDEAATPARAHAHSPVPRLRFSLTASQSPTEVADDGRSERNGSPLHRVADAFSLGLRTLHVLRERYSSVSPMPLSTDDAGSSVLSSSTGSNGGLPAAAHFPAPRCRQAPRLIEEAFSPLLARASTFSQLARERCAAHWAEWQSAALRNAPVGRPKFPRADESGSRRFPLLPSTARRAMAATPRGRSLLRALAVGWWRIALGYWWVGALSRVAVTSNWFQQVITISTLLAGALVGVETDLKIMANHESAHALHTMDTLVLAIFTVEIVLKVVAEYDRPLKPFRNSWNMFDLVIVLASYTLGGSMVTMLRLLRLLRVLKLVRAVPELQVIISALMSGLSSIGFIGVILTMVFYMFAVLGVIMFASNDPEHFGVLHRAMLTLFRCATLESWSSIMYTQVYGCRKANFEAGSCTHPFAWGVFAAAYFIIFVIITSMVLLALFIGVVSMSMEQALDEQEKVQLSEARVRIVQELQGLSGEAVQQLCNCFNNLDLDGGGSLDVTELAVGLSLVKGRSSGGSDAGSGAGDAAADTEMVASLLQEVDDNNSGEVDLAEFLLFMSAMRTKDRQRVGLLPKGEGGAPEPGGIAAPAEDPSAGSGNTSGDDGGDDHGDVNNGSDHAAASAAVSVEAQLEALDPPPLPDVLRVSAHASLGSALKRGLHRLVGGEMQQDMHPDAHAPAIAEAKGERKPSHPDEEVAGVTPRILLAGAGHFLARSPSDVATAAEEAASSGDALHRSPAPSARLTTEEEAARRRQREAALERRAEALIRSTSALDGSDSHSHPGRGDE